MVYPTTFPLKTCSCKKFHFTTLICTKSRTCKFYLVFWTHGLGWGLLGPSLPGRALRRARQRRRLGGEMKDTRRAKEVAVKRAAKDAAMRQPKAKSKYAIKKNEQRNGNYRP